MKLKDESSWNEFVKNNQDSYGSGVVRYAERWADMMEERLAAGEVLSDFAKQASHDADNEGITVFMYGRAVDVLAKVWEHGEELRQWHNLDTQIHNEGEKANESGGVLDPALLNIAK